MDQVCITLAYYIFNASNFRYSVLFFEDPEPVAALQKAFPTYNDKFPDWSQHTNAIHQYILWTALETEGLGCSLQVRFIIIITMIEKKKRLSCFSIITL